MLENIAYSLCILLFRLNPLMPTVAIWVQLWVQHPVQDRVKPSFVIFDIWAL